MGLKSFINEHGMRDKWVDLSKDIESPGIYYGSLDDALSDINTGGNFKASYIKGNLMSLGIWNTQISEDGHTILGVTFVRDGNTIIANGTATDTIGFPIIYASSSSSSMRLLSGKTYRLSGCPAGGSNATYSLWLNVPSDTLQDTGDGVFYTPTEETLAGVYIVVRKGVTVTNAVFNPAVEVCSIDTASLASFEIFGQKINRNLVDMYSLWNRPGLITVEADGSMTGELANFYARKFSLDAYAGSIITASVKAKIVGELPDKVVNANLQIYNTAGRYIKAISTRLTERSSTYTLLYASAVVEEGDVVQISYNSGATANVTEFQIELGAAPTAYKPFEAISEDKDYVSVVRLTQDAVRDESNTVSAYPDNLILDLNGHKLTSSTQIGMNNGTAENSMCFYGMKPGSEITSSAKVPLYARNKETYILGGTYESTSTSSSEERYILYNTGYAMASSGGKVFTDSRSEIHNAHFKVAADTVALAASKQHQALAIQTVEDVVIENCTIDAVSSAGVIGCYYNYAPSTGGNGSLKIRNVKVDVVTSATEQTNAFGLYIAGGNQSDIQAACELRDCYVRAVSQDFDDYAASGVMLVLNQSHPEAASHIVNCEFYGASQGIQVDYGTTYIRNCILGGGGHGGIYASYNATVYLTDTCLQRIYKKINNNVITGAAGLGYFGYGSKTYMDNCTHWIDPYFNQTAHAHITVKPGESSYNDKTVLYVSNFKIDRIRVDGYSSCYVGENVTNLDGTDKPTMWFHNVDGNVYYTDENYRGWKYPEKDIAELATELKECRQKLSDNADNISISGNIDKSLLPTASLKTIIEILTKGADE